MIKDLFEHYLEKSDALPPKIHQQITDEKMKPIIIKDYIAGMTDNFAKQEWEKLTH